jgi:glycosyltransferase 2 family protein
MPRPPVFWIRLIVAALLVALLFAGSSSLFDDVLIQLSDVSIALVFAALAVFLISNTLGAAQWGVFLQRTGVHIPYARVLTYYCTGLFFNSLLFSNVGGDAVKVFDAARSEGIRPSRILAGILVDRVVGFLCLISLGAAAACVYAFSAPSADPLLLVSYALLLGTGGGALLFFFSIRLRFFVFRLVRRLPAGRIRSAGLQFVRALNCYAKDPGVFRRALLYGLSNQLLKLAAAYITAAAFSQSIPGLLYFFMVIPLLGIIKIIPLSVLGLGAHELVAGQRLFASAGLDPSVSVSFLLLFQVVVLCSNMICGIFFFFRRNRSSSPEKKLKQL